MTLTVTYQGHNGFVTDFGEELISDDKSLVIPRYGVWKPRYGKPQVVFTTNDLDAARREAEK